MSSEQRSRSSTSVHCSGGNIGGDSGRCATKASTNPSTFSPFNAESGYTSVQGWSSFQRSMRGSSWVRGTASILLITSSVGLCACLT